MIAVRRDSNPSIKDSVMYGGGPYTTGLAHAEVEADKIMAVEISIVFLIACGNRFYHNSLFRSIKASNGGIFQWARA